MLKATWRSLMAHKARMLMSGLAVVLGVAFVVGTFIFTDTLKGTFDELFSGEVADVIVSEQLAVGDDDGTGSVRLRRVRSRFSTTSGPCLRSRGRRATSRSWASP